MQTSKTLSNHIDPSIWIYYMIKYAKQYISTYIQEGKLSKLPQGKMLSFH